MLRGSLERKLIEFENEIIKRGILHFCSPGTSISSCYQSIKTDKRKNSQVQSSLTAATSSGDKVRQWPAGKSPNRRGPV